jgi:hypothetical protein
MEQASEEEGTARDRLRTPLLAADLMEMRVACALIIAALQQDNFHKGGE